MLPKVGARREVVTIRRGAAHPARQSLAGLPGSGQPAILRGPAPSDGHDLIMTTRKVIEPPGISKIIASLNSLSLGKMEVIGANLAEARQACLDLDETELADRLGEAHGALLRGDVKTYRKRVESVVSQLGLRR